MLKRIAKHKKASMCLREKINELDKLPSGRVTVLLAMCSKLMNQQYILHKVFLNRNIHKGYYVATG